MSELENPVPVETTSAIEALLFVSAEPVNAQQLAAALDVPVVEIEKHLILLENTLADRGLRLQKHGGRFQLTAAPEFAEKVEKFLGLEATTHLSRAGLETLAIVAFQQPVTRPQIEAIRGVSSDGVMRSLLSKGLIQEVGRTEGPGRPILYGTAPEFLQHFGLDSLSQLPQLNLSDVEGNDGNHNDMLKG
jgi:segregation and condensation protein B